MIFNEYFDVNDGSDPFSLDMVTTTGVCDVIWSVTVGVNKSLMISANDDPMEIDDGTKIGGGSTSSRNDNIRWGGMTQGEIKATIDKDVRCERTWCTNFMQTQLPGVKPDSPYFYPHPFMLSQEVSFGRCTIIKALQMQYHIDCGTRVVLI